MTVFGVIFLSAKWSKNRCLKHKSLNINLLFIELLFKINITFVIMLIFEEKKAWNVNIYIFCPHILNSVIILNALIDWIMHWKNTRALFNRFIITYTNVCMHSVGVLFDLCKILDIVKLHIVKTTITILSQTIYITHPYVIPNKTPSNDFSTCTSDKTPKNS